MNIALIFAGGIGSRFDMTDIPKQFMKVNDKEIIIHTLEKFQLNSKIDEIIVVMVSDWIDYTRDLLRKYDINKVTYVVEGGASGQESIYNGVKKAKENYPSDSTILIHDGVRPIVDDNIINENIKSVNEKGNAITVAPAIETIIVTDNGVIVDVNDRANSWYAKAPQSFVLEDVYNHHIKSLEDGITSFIDTASMMTHYGQTLHTVVGSSENIKVTTNKDYYMLKAILEEEEKNAV